MGFMAVHRRLAEKAKLQRHRMQQRCRNRARGVEQRDAVGAGGSTTPVDGASWAEPVIVPSRPSVRWLTVSDTVEVTCVTVAVKLAIVPETVASAVSTIPLTVSATV